MASLSIEHDLLIFRFTGFEMLWALKRELRIPLDAVHAARVERVRVEKLLGTRCCGTYLPYVIAAGTFSGAARKKFYSVRHDEEALVVDVSGGAYERCLVTVADPANALIKLVRALPSTAASPSTLDH